MMKSAALAEFTGTALLLVAVVGSGIMGENLSQGNAAIALLANSLATGCALAALILTFGPISGAHLNPVVSVAAAWQGDLPWRRVPSYCAAQFSGALAGVAIADYLFGKPAFTLSQHVRAGNPQLASECLATFGLLATIIGCVRSRPPAVPFAVAAYITGAYWFTPSTSFANPAVTLARAFTDTFAGIRLADVAGFVGAQCVGGCLAMALFWRFHRAD
jgi:glycerol uptake facilitator-like aquaporin